MLTSVATATTATVEQVLLTSRFLSDAGAVDRTRLDFATTPRVSGILFPGRQTRFGNPYAVRLSSKSPSGISGQSGHAPPSAGGGGGRSVRKTFQFNGLDARVYNPLKSNNYLLYVHGGPGSHGDYFFNGIQEMEPYRNINYGWISYDQRGCGRSKQKADTSPITHEDNVKDLLELAAHIRNERGMNLVAVMGHSYGAWLAYDMLAANTDFNAKLVMLGQCPSIHLPRDRSLLIDLALLKLYQPDDYARIYPQLIGPPSLMWRHSKLVRNTLHDTTQRRSFYWANPEAMKWYADIQDKVGISDNVQTFAEVMRSLKSRYDDIKFVIDPISRIKHGFLWVLGYHDFLMGGEIDTDPEKYPMVKFWQSAHYPHFEEPTRFCDELVRFLDEP